MWRLGTIFLICVWGRVIKRGLGCRVIAYIKLEINCGKFVKKKGFGGKCTMIIGENITKSGEI